LGYSLLRLPPRERPLRFTTSVTLGERRGISAVTPTGIVNQVLFHEGGHGYTGAIDPSLLDAYGYRAFNDPPCLITDYLELKIWAGANKTCGN
jgi:hypothetical protein